MSCRGTKARGTGPGGSGAAAGGEPRGARLLPSPGPGMRGEGAGTGVRCPRSRQRLRAAGLGPTARQRLRKCIYNFAAGWAVRASAGAISGRVALSGAFPVGAAAVDVPARSWLLLLPGGGSGAGRHRVGTAGTGALEVVTYPSLAVVHRAPPVGLAGAG